MRGGKNICTLPAGYLGSSFWGCFFIIMTSAGPLPLQLKKKHHHFKYLVFAQLYEILCIFDLIIIKNRCWDDVCLSIFVSGLESQEQCSASYVRGFYCSHYW